MSTQAEATRGVVFWIVVLLLVLFCAGDPDLLDAIITRVLWCG